MAHRVGEEGRKKIINRRGRQGPNGRVSARTRTPWKKQISKESSYWVCPLTWTS